MTAHAPSVRPLWRIALLLAAAAVMVARAPVYFATPSFWAEEGMMHFAVAWARSPLTALTYRHGGYLNVWVNVATTTAAGLVHAGVVSLARAPLVTVLFAFVVQLLPVALIAWSRAPFWDGALRRTVGVGIVLFGAMTDEIWLTSLHSKNWLVVATVLLLLEPPGATRPRALAATAILLVAGLSSPVASLLFPLFAWRAWRTRERPAVAEAVALATCLIIQALCLWSAVRAAEALSHRTTGLRIGVFAATVWMRTLIVPTLGAGAADGFVDLLQRVGGPGMASGILLLALAVAVLACLARGERAETSTYLAGSYATITTLSLLTSIGDKAMLLHSAAASSRYVYAPGVLVLLILLGCARSGAGRLRAILCTLLVGSGLAHGVAVYRSSLRWQPGWPVWPEEVRAWELDPSRSLRIWPPGWSMTLAVPVRR